MSFIIFKEVHWPAVNNNVGESSHKREANLIEAVSVIVFRCQILF